MRGLGRTATVTAMVTALGAGWSFGSDPVDDAIGTRSPVCDQQTLKGVYGIQMQGTRPSGPPPAPMETVTGVVLRIYDGQGGLTQLGNIKGSITGLPPEPIAGFGTYDLNADCTGETHFDPGSGTQIVERLVIVDGGREVFSIVASPAPVMVATVQKKIR